MSRVDIGLVEAMTAKTRSPLAKLLFAQEERRARWGIADGAELVLRPEDAGEYALEFALELGLDVELAEAGINTGMSREERLALEDSDESPFMRRSS
jgi:hypothetical protein